VEYELNGKIYNKTMFDLTPLIDAIQAYVDHYDHWSDDERIEHWCKVVGGEQSRVIAIIAQHYCDPDQSFSEANTFDKEKMTRNLDFYNAVHKEQTSWFPRSDSAYIHVLGVDFGCCRHDASLDEAQLARRMPQKKQALMDLNALITLRAVRAEQIAGFRRKIREPRPVKQQAAQKNKKVKKKKEKRCRSEATRRGF
jgi:hypothetical protein